MTDRTRAIDKFLEQTGFDNNKEADLRTAQQLKRMRDEETEKQLQNMQQNYKRMREFKERKKAKEQEKDDFMKQI